MEFEKFASEALSSGLFLREVKDRMEKAFVTIAMMRSRGNESKAAIELGVHRNTLLRWMDTHQLRRETFVWKSKGKAVSQ